MGNGESDLARPSWMPSDEVLAAIVPVGQFLARTERVIVALSHVSVHPNGCMFDVRASARGTSVAWDVFERMVFTAGFGAGITAAMDDEEPFRRRSRGEDAFVLLKYGQEGDGTVLNANDRRVNCTLRLWLYPLPPPEPGTLSVTSPDLGLELASCPLDWPTIVAAGAGARPYWR